MPEALPLRDIIAIEPSWWPPAPLIWMLAVLGCLALWWLVKWIRHVLRYQYADLQYAALVELGQIENNHQYTDQQFASEVSSLLKRVALQRFPDKNLAHLSGDQWLGFLDNAVNTQAFQNLGGENLDAAQYRASSKLDQAALLNAASQWIHAI